MRDRPDTPVTVLVIDDETQEIVGCVHAPRVDLALIDALAHLQLSARRRGATVRLRGAPPALVVLLEVVGLAGVLALEARGQAELGEQLGVQEVVQPDDLLP